MLNSVAAASMGMSNAQFVMDYSVSVSKKAMDTQEVVAQKMIEMMQQAAPPTPAKGKYIDVYA